MAPGSRRERGFRLPRARRISSGREIRAVFGRGKRSRTNHLDVLVAASPVDFSRVGWVVPLHGHGTVERNRLKRRLRELARLELLPRLDGADERVDVLVRARREAYGAGYDQLRDEVVAWLDRHWPHEPRSA